MDKESPGLHDSRINPNQSNILIDSPIYAESQEVILNNETTLDSVNPPLLSIGGNKDVTSKDTLLTGKYYDSDCSSLDSELSYKPSDEFFLHKIRNHPNVQTPVKYFAS